MPTQDGGEAITGPVSTGDAGGAAAADGCASDLAAMHEKLLFVPEIVDVYNLLVEELSTRVLSSELKHPPAVWLCAMEDT